jgi:hypothetical protein
MSRLLTSLPCIVAGSLVSAAILAAQAPPIPYPQADRLVLIRGMRSNPSFADLRDFAAGMPTLLSVEAFRLSGADLIRPTEPRAVPALTIIGRLRDPAEFDLAAQQAQTVATKMAETYPRNRGTSARLVRLIDELRPLATNP